MALANIMHAYQPDIGALGTRSNLASLTDPAIARAQLLDLSAALNGGDGCCPALTCTDLLGDTLTKRASAVLPTRRSAAGKGTGKLARRATWPGCDSVPAAAASTSASGQ